MKKRYLYIMIGLIFLQSACSKVLDTEPLDRYSEGAVWSNFPMAQGYVYTLYNMIIQNYYTSGWTEEALTKNAVTGKGGTLYVPEKTNLITKESDHGWRMWGNVRAINIGIQHVEASEFTEAQKNLLRGECYFLRAAINFYMVKRFGGIQLIDKVLTPEDSLMIPRSSAKASYDFILSDLETAATNLPTTNTRGRATKGAAFALTMRVGLQAGAYLNDNSYYQKVITAGNSLFALGLYSLDTYSNLFSAYGTAIASPENIFVCERLKINTSTNNTGEIAFRPQVGMTSSMMTAAAMAKYPLANQIDGGMTIAPTQELVDDYLVTDIDGNEKVSYNTTYNATGANVYTKMYKNRDLRFYTSIVYDSCKYFTNQVFTRKDGNISDESIGGGVTTAGLGSGTRSGYLFRKGVLEDLPLTRFERDFCFSILRLGEAYLNYAEAALLLGDEATARTYIAKTYQKHGGFKNSITSTGANLWTDYKRERNVEMTLEGDRYWSLLRWGMQKSGGLQSDYASSGYIIPELVGKMRAIKIDGEGKTYQIIEIVDNGGLPLEFTPRRYLFPIPYSDIQNNKNLTQNPGWE